MSTPTRSDVHVNRPLTNISIAFIQNAANFVAARVFPNVPVQKQSDEFFTYDRGSFNRDEMKQRAPGAESAGGGYEISTDTYAAKVYAFHKDVADQIRNNADSPLALDREASIYVTQKALLKREKLWSSAYFGTGVWTTDVTGVASSVGTGEVLQWNDASSTPIEDVAEGKEAILESTGFEPNTMVIGYPVWKSLKNHPDIIDRIKYNAGSGDAPAMVTQRGVAALFEVDRLFVMKGIENTATEGATAAHSFIGGKKALLCHSAMSPGLMTPSAGYTFSWTGHVGAGPEGNAISRFRLDRIKSDRIEIEMAFDQKKVAADLGYFWDSIVA